MFISFLKIYFPFQENTVSRHGKDHDGFVFSDFHPKSFDKALYGSEEFYLVSGGEFNVTAFLSNQDFHLLGLECT